jgi:hypothetical protein
LRLCTSGRAGVGAYPPSSPEYIDGQEVGRKPTKLDYLDDPFYMIINYALRDPLDGEPFGSKGRSAKWGIPEC